MGKSRHSEKRTDKPEAPEGEKTTRGKPSCLARRWVQPRKKSEIIAMGGEM